MRLSLLTLVLLFSAACGDADHGPGHDDALANEHDGDTTEATSIVQPPRQPVAARAVSYGPADGYYAMPQDSTGALPGLLVIHEWWGLNDNIRAMAERFAGEGYRVLAVDLYGGHVAQSPDSAMVYAKTATGDLAAARANLVSAYRYLTAHGAEKVGVVGWCMGGFFSLQAALALPDEIDATVLYYGNIADVTADQLRTLRMPVRAFFGEADSSIPLDAVHRFEARLEEAGVAHEVTTYAGAGHAFANPTGQNYEAGPAQDSWEKTLAFFASALK